MTNRFGGTNKQKAKGEDPKCITCKFYSGLTCKCGGTSYVSTLPESTCILHESRNIKKL